MEGDRPCFWFSYLRPENKLQHLFEQNRHLVLSAPVGSGKTTLLNQWLHSRKIKYQRHPLEAFVTATAESPVFSANAVTTSATREKLWLLETPLLTAASFRRLLKTLGAMDESGHRHLKIIILTQATEMAACHQLKEAGFVSVGVNELAFDADEIREMVDLSQNTAVRSRVYHSIYSHSLGWPLATFAALNHVTQNIQGETDLNANDYQASILNCLTNTGSPAPGAAPLLQIIANVGELPSGAIKACCNEPTAAMNFLVWQGLAQYQPGYDSEGVLSLSALGKLWLAFIGPADNEALLQQVIHWLCEHNQYERAIPVLLAQKRTNAVEQLLLKAGDRLVSRLRTHDLYRWISQLDNLCHIQHPCLLLLATRTLFYEGRLHELNAYFRRLQQAVTEQSLAQLQSELSSRDYFRFLSEYQLCCTALRIDPGIAGQTAQLSDNSFHQENTYTLLYKSLQLAEKGDLNTAIPMLQAGIDKTGASEETPLHMMFSLIYIWVLVLSCNLERAEAFIKELHGKLRQTRVVYLAACDWLDVMELLLLRIKGDINTLQKKLPHLLATEAFTNDFQKHYLLLNLEADLYLVKKNLYEARRSICQLENLQSTSSKQSYWMATADTMKTVLTGLDKNRNSTSELTESSNGLAEQTRLLWQQKQKMHHQPLYVPLATLEPLHEQLVKDGQWLRVMESDVMRAVCLHRQKRRREAASLFERLFTSLENKACLGVLLDPFLLWGELLHAVTQPAIKTKALALYRNAREFESAHTRSRTNSIVTPPYEPLSPREKQVLELIVAGHSSQAMADQLCISVTTVRSHIQNIYRKLAVYNRAEATAVAIKNGLINNV